MTTFPKKATNTKTGKYPRVLIVDGDQYCFKVAIALQQGVNWGDGIHTTFADDREGITTLDKALHELFEMAEADAMVIALSSPKNFRKKLDATYKENRADVPKPLILPAMREHMIATRPCKSCEWLEADDVMGIMATNPKDQRELILVSDDKDMKQIPGKLYRPTANEFLEITAEDGYRFHMYQTLVGDRADNYPGCPKVGDVKAKAILDAPVDELWNRVVKTYEKVGLSEKDALLQARLSKILQFENFDVANKKVKLWVPSLNRSSANTATVPSTPPVKKAPTKTAASTKPVKKQASQTGSSVKATSPKKKKTAPVKQVVAVKKPATKAKTKVAKKPAPKKSLKQSSQTKKKPRKK